MATYPSGTNLYHALLAEGFELPKECGDVSLLMPVDGVLQLHYTVNVLGDDLAKLGRALTRIGEDAKDGINVRKKRGSDSNV
jgi:hypothetical protein